MSFNDQYQEMDEQLRDTFGTPDAVITIPDGSTITAAVILGPESADVQYDDSGSERVYRRQASFVAADVGTVPLMSTVAVSGQNYRIERIISDDGSMINVEMFRSVDVSRHEDVRMKRMR